MIKTDCLRMVVKKQLFSRKVFWEMAVFCCSKKTGKTGLFSLDIERPIGF
ncbi:hypothetical protein JHE06_00795 [Carnobacterium sp. CS13]|nr:hypothetical protein [Carnobacterium sp. CS13]QQP70412.1 hypothetical protein JHE06_00795 [Carnobacterium sp. CS13]